MARKTKQEAALTRHKILDTALTVFSERGYPGATLQEIAERAGFTRGAFYWHFKSKLDLLIALAEDIEHGSDAATDNEVDSLEELAEVLSAHLRRFVTDRRYGVFYRTIMLQTGWTGEVEPFAAMYRNDQADLLAWLEGLVLRLQETAQITSDRPADLLALGISACFNGLIAIWLVDPQAIDMTTTAPESMTDYLERLKP